ncbi:MAG: hypothetical protein AAFP19_15395 [Bacteroidota bacterium]
MPRPKVFLLLDQLSSQQIKRFDLFLKSPYINSNKKLPDLLKAQGLKEEDLKTLHRIVYPKEVYNKQMFKNRLSQLMKAYKQFLAIELVLERPRVSNALAREKVKEMGLQESINLDKQSIGFDQVLNHSHFTLRFNEAVSYEEINPMKGGKMDLAFAYNALEKYYLYVEATSFSTKVNLLFNYVYFQRKYPMEFKSPVFEAALKNFKVPVGLENTLLAQLYDHAFRLAVHPNEADYQSLKTHCFDQLDQLHIDHMEVFLSILGNYCVANINKGESRFYEGLYDIYFIRLKHSKSNNLSYAIVFSFTAIGCKVGKIEEVSDYLDRIETRLESSTYSFCKALILYYSEQYQASLLSLNQVNFKSEVYQINVKHLIIKTLFALEEYEPAIDQIESLRIFLIRTKELSSVRKKNNGNFLKYFKKIIKLIRKAEIDRQANYYDRYEDLKRELQVSTNIIDKSYLIKLLDTAMTK